MGCTRVARRGVWHTVAAGSAIVVATALAGCGGGPNKIVLPKHPVRTTSTTDLPGDDPCKLLTHTDVSNALGMPFATGTRCTSLPFIWKTCCMNCGDAPMPGSWAV